MLTYKFYVSKTDKLTVRLRNNNRKIEIGLLEQTTQAELDYLLDHIGSTAGHHCLKMKLSGFIAILTQISNQLKDELRTNLDVVAIAEMLKLQCSTYFC